MKFRRGWMPTTIAKGADAAANTNTTFTSFWRAPCDCEIIEGHMWSPAGTVTANDSNYATIALQKVDGVGGSAVAIGSITTKLAASGGTGDWAANVPVGMDMSHNHGLDVLQGELVGYVITKSNGVGVSIPSSIIEVTFRPHRKMIG